LLTKGYAMLVFRKKFYIFIVCVMFGAQLHSLLAMKHEVFTSHQQLYTLAEAFKKDGKKDTQLEINACNKRKKYITQKVGFSVINPDVSWSKEDNKITSMSPLGCYWNKYKSVCVTVLLYENSENHTKDLVFNRYQLGQNGKIDQWNAQWHNFNEALIDSVYPCFDSNSNFCLYNSSSFDIIEYSISSAGVKSTLPCNLCFKENDEWRYESFADIKEEALLEAILTAECFKIDTADCGTLNLYPIRSITFPDIYISYLEKQPMLFRSWLRSLDVSSAARRAIKQAIFAQAVSEKLKKWVQVGCPKRRS
jgi:hypothetical protein